MLGKSRGTRAIAAWYLSAPSRADRLANVKPFVTEGDFSSHLHILFRRVVRGYRALQRAPEAAGIVLAAKPNGRRSA